MELKGITGGLYRMTEWVFKLAYINLLWIIFTVIGLGVFGIGPSTSAMFTVIRKWLDGQGDRSTHQLFIATYKSEFFKANGLFWIFFMAFFILYVDFKFIVDFEGAVKVIGYSVFFMLLLLVFITFMYVFPINAYYETTIKNCIRSAFLISIYLFPSSIMIIVSLYLYFLLIKFMPGILPLFGASLIGFVLMWIAYKGFLRLPKSILKDSEA